jgi:arylsulfatase A-like enzyme/cytochrome c-type biogenesis protein CcmH/NrfG
MRPFIFLICLSLIPGCREAPVERPRELPIFLISIDTLRSDHLPVYGYTAGLTPAIDAFRRDAVLFSRAFSHCPLTLPSHASLMTGLLPPRHGVRDNAGYALTGSHTLAELLRQKGYRTGAAVSSYVLRRSTGIDRGFEFFDDAMDSLRGRRPQGEEKDGEKTARILLDWIGAQQDPRIFGFLHLYEPHTPYQPPEQYAALAPYDGEIAHADAIVGGFLQELKRRGLYDKALIVLLSDHGEGLGDHNEDEHGVFVYRESLQVPLLIKYPDQRDGGGRIEAPVGLVDIFPTILTAAKIQIPTDIDGIDLRGSLATSRRIYAETYFPRLHLGWSELLTLLDDRYHYIEAPRDELYDYVEDPQEKNNRITEDRRVAAAMRQQLQTVDQKFATPGPLSEEERRRLAALGYVGSSVPGAGEFPDPKDRVSYIRDLKAAYASYEARNYERAIAQLSSLIRQNPDMIDGWSLLAQSYRAIGQRQRAVDTIREALKKFPSNPDLALLASEFLLESRDYAGAKLHAELALPQSEVAAQEMLAKIALAEGDLVRAEQQIAKVLRLDPRRLATLLLRSDLLKRRRQFAEQLQVLDSVLAADPAVANSIPRLHYERGLALMELHRVREAEEALRRETELFPTNLEAWGMLAIALAAQQRLAEAEAVLAQAEKRNPGEPARKLVRETRQVLRRGS